MRAWLCSECACSREMAERKRKRLGLPVLYPWAKTCSQPCARKRERRRSLAKYGPGTKYYRDGLRRRAARGGGSRRGH